MRLLQCIIRHSLIAAGLLCLGLSQAQAGCCNTNYWCDGDPSFLETPDVTQHENSPWILVSWSNAYLRLAKCVDYFYLEYAHYNNITNAEEVNYKILPVYFDRRPMLDEWQSPLEPLVNRFWSNITVDFDTDYIIRGSGWGDLEGKAIVFSEPIFYRTLPKIPPEIIVRRKIDKLYPPNSCSASRLCSELAAEWIMDVSGYVGRALHFHDPIFLESISVIIDEEDGEERKYDQGRIHHISKATMSLTGANEDLDNEAIRFNVTFTVRPFRVSYAWSSFMTEGILSLYYTCGKELPMAIFLDVDEDEVVEELSNSNCSFPITAHLTVPVRPSQIEPGVEAVTFPVDRDSFKYDVTWFSAHLHELDQMWPQQVELIRKKLTEVFTLEFKEAFSKLSPRVWLKAKYQSLEESVRQAKESNTEMQVEDQKATNDTLTIIYDDDQGNYTEYTQLDEESTNITSSTEPASSTSNSTFEID